MKIKMKPMVDSSKYVSRMLQLVSVLLLILSISCAVEVDYPVKNTRSCLQSISSAQLRKITREFIYAKPEMRAHMLEGISYIARKHKNSPTLPYVKLANYLKDISTAKHASTNGTNLNFSSLDGVELIEWPFAAVDLHIRPWKRIQEPVWHDYPIPRHLMVENFPVFRGERNLLKGLGHDAFPLARNSLVWSHLRTLFSQGTTSYDSPARDIWHQDVFKHTGDSLGSPYLGSTRDYDIARRFGKRPATSWSAIIEARVEGIDINKVGEYFEALDFLKAPASMLPIEREVAINFGIQAYDIRGVWFHQEGGFTYFVKNPNFVKNKP